MRLLARNNTFATIAIIELIKNPYINHPSAPIIIAIRIAESFFKKLDNIINVAAKYDVPVNATPSNMRYAAILFIIKNIYSHLFELYLIAIPNRSAPIIARTKPLIAPSK